MMEFFLIWKSNKYEQLGYLWTMIVIDNESFAETINDRLHKSWYFCEE